MRGYVIEGRPAPKCVFLQLEKVLLLMQPLNHFSNIHSPECLESTK
jgi:hypothetical protein